MPGRSGPMPATPDWLRNQARVAVLVNAKITGDQHLWSQIANLARRCGQLIDEPHGLAARPRLREAARLASDLSRTLSESSPIGSSEAVPRPGSFETQLDLLTAELAGLIADMTVVDPAAAAETVASLSILLARRYVAELRRRRWGRRR